MTLTELEHSLDCWIAALQRYDLELLQTQPVSGGWSLGQLYLHILNDTNFYITQAKGCLNHNAYQSEEMTAFAASLFAQKAFPDERIKGDPLAGSLPQPHNKESLLEQLMQLRSRVAAVWSKVATSRGGGKSLHPGLGYFNALEWLQFAGMHMRHHLRQKQRIERALGCSPTDNM